MCFAPFAGVDILGNSLLQGGEHLLVGALYLIAVDLHTAREFLSRQGKTPATTGPDTTAIYFHIIVFFIIIRPKAPFILFAAETSGQSIDNVGGHFEFRLHGIVGRTAVAVPYRHLVGIATESRSGIAQGVQYNKVEILTLHLGDGIFGFVVGFPAQSRPGIVRHVLSYPVRQQYPCWVSARE